MKISADVDIDFGDRDTILKHIRHTPAAMLNTGQDPRRHNSGVYVSDIPYDPVEQMASIDYREAEERGYFKLDFLNVHVYNHVRDEDHLTALMREPDWSKLKDRDFVEQLVHLNSQYYNIQKMPEPIDSIPRLAMFLAMIRPGKKHLIGFSWKEVNESVWEKGVEEYTFKKSHAIAYAHLVVIHMNLISEGVRAFSLQE